MISTARVLFSESNLHHNLSVLKRHARGAELMAMVKADAYGHGLVAVAQRLSGVRFGVATLEEALTLRRAGIEAPIMVMRGACTSEELHRGVTAHLTFVFHTPEQLTWLSDLPSELPLRAWVKVDTGMGRLGFSPADLPAVRARLKGHPSVRYPIGLLSHLACADEAQHPLTRHQIDRFKALAVGWDGPKSLANSAALLSGVAPLYDLVRPGLALYGASPFPGVSANTLDLKPVMTFEAPLLAQKYADQGALIGYGGTYRCPEAMPFGIIGLGYGDGYPRTSNSSAAVVIQGVRCPLIGRVSMDMMAVDLRPAPTASPGTPVQVWGSHLSIGEVSVHCERSPYDLLTGVTARPNRVWACV